MWKNIKKKVTDFIFEEIEEEFDDADFEENTKSYQLKDDEKVRAKVTYEYPKKTESPFRFPLIPDESTYKDAKKDESEIKRSPIKRKYRNRQQRKRTNISDSYTSIYNEKKKQKELEDIPAFMRRKREDDELTYDEYDSTNHLDEAEEESLLSYSKPAELDEVFNRYNKREKKQQMHQAVRTDQFNREDFNVSSKGKLRKTDLKTIHHQSEVFFEAENYENDKQYENITAQKQVFSIEDEESTEKITPFHKPQLFQQDTMTQQENVDVPKHLLNDLIERHDDDYDWLVQQQYLLEDTLKHFHIDAKIVAVTQGPSVTRIEIQPALGVKVSKIRNLADDIKLNLAAKDIRIEAPIPGKNTVGIEIPNQYPQIVQLKEMIESSTFQEAQSPLAIALGLSIEGEPYITDIAKMPHCLIAGATGSGKSVCINSIILSLLFKASHDEVKLMMIDPKMVELTPYNGIPHLLAPIITDPKAATMALKWAVDEMERRYEQFVAMGVRNIAKYNEKVTHEQGEKMPFIVIIIDELADLMIVSPQEVEDYICRIAQKARAAGIHLILATQRPSVDVITGLIKANVPTRIAFSVSSQVDSRTILDTNGAEKLLGKGDMLFHGNGMNKSIRLQGPFVADDEIDRVAHYLRKVAEPNYLFEQEELLLTVEDEEEDELLHEVISFVVSSQKASTSLLQRRFRIGYNRAARLIDTLYERGIISAQNGSKPRDVLLSKSEWDRLNDE